MLSYIVRRVLLMIPTLFLVSVVSFVLLQLPPGDYLTAVRRPVELDRASLSTRKPSPSLRERYGLGEPVYVQYVKWVEGIVTRGDWGQSMEWQKPVASSDLGSVGTHRSAGRLFAFNQLVDRDPRRRLHGHASVFAA